MARCKDSDYKCSLDKTTLEKAQNELGENPETRLLEIKNLRKRLEKVPGLKSRTDTEFLLAFLRARKFNQERTFQMIQHHYQEKKERPEHYEDLKPSKVKHMIDDNFLEVLQHRDNQGCRVIVVRPGRWDPDRYPVKDPIRLIYLVLSKLSEEEETQVHGIHVIDCLDTITWKQGAGMTPSAAKHMASTLQDMVPLRLKRYDFVHEPTFFDVIFPVFKSFMKEKMVSRIILNGNKYDGLHATISPDHLPTDLGGKLEPFSYNKEWMSRFMELDKEFEYNNKFGFLSMSLENEKKEDCKEDAGLQGLGGAFKKLDV